jgi:metal-dependent amidase/aminoacylase/carboxypeptidase family protein
VLPTAARLLKEREQELSGTVLLIFQPAEEALAGAKHMVEEGALDGVTAVHGLHVAPSLHSGVIGTRVSVVTSVLLLSPAQWPALPHIRGVL